MENENNTNRDDTVPVSPTLGAIGGQGGENGATLVEGLGTFGGATDETLQASAGGIVISPMRVQQFFEGFRDLILSRGDDVLSNTLPRC